MVSYCSLHCRIKGAEKTGPVLLGQRSRSAGIRSQLPQVPGYLTTGKGVTYICRGPLFAGRGDDARPVFETAGCQRDIGGDADVVGRNMLCNPVIGRICRIADRDHSYVRGARRPDWSRAIGDNENAKPKTSRHAIDLLPHRTRITIDVDVSQTPACCFSTTAIPAASTIASAPLPP
jgi:hypothetical protein